MPWIALGTLVVTNNDEGEHLQTISAQSTRFNAPMEWCSAHSAIARVGLRGHRWVQKWSAMIFSKVVIKPLGELNQMV